MFPDEKTAEAWFEGERWGMVGMFCPRCGGCDRVKPIESRKPMPYYCGDCKKRFSVRTGTVMERSKIPLHKWGRRYLHGNDKPQKRIQYETAPRPRRYSENRLVHAAPHPSSL